MNRARGRGRERDDQRVRERERERKRERDDQRGTSSPQARTTARSPNCSVFQDYSNLPLSWEMESTSMARRKAKWDMIKLASKVASKASK